MDTRCSRCNFRTACVVAPTMTRLFPGKARLLFIHMEKEKSLLPTPHSPLPLIRNR